MEKYSALRRNRIIPATTTTHGSLAQIPATDSPRRHRTDGRLAWSTTRRRSGTSSRMWTLRPDTSNRMRLRGAQPLFKSPDLRTHSPASASIGDDCYGPEPWDSVSHQSTWRNNDDHRPRKDQGIACPRAGRHRTGVSARNITRANRRYACSYPRGACWLASHFGEEQRANNWPISRAQIDHLSGISARPGVTSYEDLRR
jgi:hypothetical protein